MTFDPTPGIIPGLIPNTPYTEPPADWHPLHEDLQFDDDPVGELPYPAPCGTLDPVTGLPYREFADNPALARLVDEAMDEDTVRVLVAAYRLGMEDGIEVGAEEGYDLGDDRYGPWND